MMLHGRNGSSTARTMAGWVAAGLAALLVAFTLNHALGAPTAQAGTAEPLLSDTFSRVVSGGWGSADVGGSYASLGLVSAFSVRDGAGLLTHAAKGSSYTVAASNVLARDTDTTLSVATDKVATGYGQLVAVLARRGSTGEYRVRVRFAPDRRVRLSVSRRVGTTESLVGGVEPTVSGLVHTPGAPYNMRVQVSGASPTTLSAKAWLPGTAEPAGWTVSVTDSTEALQVAGAGGVLSYIGGDATNAPVVVSVDDWTVAAVARRVLGDDFSRVVTGGWGEADLGGAYLTTGPASSFAVREGRGLVTLPAKGSGHTVSVPGSVARDTDTTVSVATDKAATGYGQLVAVVARKSAPGEYRVRLRFTPDRRVRVSVSRRSGTVEGLVGAIEPVVAGLVHVPGTRYTMRVQVSGANPTTLRAKAWVEGTAEPTGWAVSVPDATDGLQTEGATGIFSYIGGDATNAPVTVSVDALRVTTVTAPSLLVSAPAPTSTPGPVTAPAPGAEPSPSVAPPSLLAAVRPTRSVVTALGSTSYAVPAGAVWVSPSGSDSATGTSALPLRTLAKAVRATPAGGTIVMRGGTYRESVELPYGKALTIQNAAGEVVWLDGSTPVTGFVAQAGTWVKTGWTTTLDSTDPSAGSADPLWRLVDPAYPMAAHPDMVFVDDVPLKQVAARGEVTPGTFFVDHAAHELVLGSDPSARRVDASVLDGGLYVNRGHGSVVRGIGLRRFATSLDQYGTLKAFANRVLVENVVVQDNATRGIGVDGTGVVLSAVTATRNGQTGIGAHLADGLQVLQSEVTLNNTERFRAAPEAGGMKVSSSRNVSVRSSNVNDNLGNGLWLDNSTLGVVVAGNHIVGNAKNGIQFEISAAGTVADNLLFGNGAAGVFVPESNDVRIYNNTLVSNHVAVDVREGTRNGTDASMPGHDPRYGPVAELLWDARRVVMRNNLMVAGTKAAPYLVGVDDATRTLKGSQMLDMDYDAWYQPDFAAPDVLVAWANYGSTPAMSTFLDLAGVRARTGMEQHGLESLGSTASPFADAARGDYRLAAGTAPRGAGQPLPADVAAVIGVSAGTPVDIGQLTGGPRLVAAGQRGRPHGMPSPTRSSTRATSAAK